MAEKAAAEGNAGDVAFQGNGGGIRGVSDESVSSWWKLWLARVLRVCIISSDHSSLVTKNHARRNLHID